MSYLDSIHMIEIDLAALKIVLKMDNRAEDQPLGHYITDEVLVQAIDQTWGEHLDEEFTAQHMLQVYKRTKEAEKQVTIVCQSMLGAFFSR